MKDIKISVIIPLAPYENLNEKLEEQLLVFPSDWEILIISSQESSCKTELKRRAQWIVADNGRANCLNAGAQNATGDYLWFLHADSILLDQTVEKLIGVMGKEESALYYFDLMFFTKSCYFLKLNEIGVYIRSRLLKTPFGDQAFFIKRKLFLSLPNYSTEVTYGEDHILVRNYRRNQVPILPIGLKIFTSARKYEKNGWLKTNSLHVFLWLKQIHEDNKKYKGGISYEYSNRNIL